MNASACACREKKKSPFNHFCRPSLTVTGDSGLSVRPPSCARRLAPGADSLIHEDQMKLGVSGGGWGGSFCTSMSKHLACCAAATAAGTEGVTEVKGGQQRRIHWDEGCSCFVICCFVFLCGL